MKREMTLEELEKELAIAIAAHKAYKKQVATNRQRIARYKEAIHALKQLNLKLENNDD